MHCINCVIKQSANIWAFEILKEEQQSQADGEQGERSRILRRFRSDLTRSLLNLKNKLVIV